MHSNGGSHERCSGIAGNICVAQLWVCGRTRAGFGLATPTNSKGEWSFDSGVFGRTNSFDSQASFRELIGYGFTPHLTLSFTAPVVFGNASLTPTRIQAGDDFDAKLAWRFQHRATKVGTRFESTAFVGLAVPGPQSGFAGIARTSNAPGTMFGAVTGMASRSHYVWIGSTFTKFYERNGNKRPDVLDYSLVYGYRPPKWRRPPDKWDWRLFGELVGERSGAVLCRRALLCPKRGRTRYLWGLRRWEFFATTRSALERSSRYIGMWVLCFQGNVCGSQSISVICYFSIPRRNHEEIYFDGCGAGVGGIFGAGRNQANGDDHIRHGLRGLCTRRARVIEVSSWS